MMIGCSSSSSASLLEINGLSGVVGVLGLVASDGEWGAVIPAVDWAGESGAEDGGDRVGLTSGDEGVDEDSRRVTARDDDEVDGSGSVVALEASSAASAGSAAVEAWAGEDEINGASPSSSGGDDENASDGSSADDTVEHNQENKQLSINFLSHSIAS